MDGSYIQKFVRNLVYVAVCMTIINYLVHPYIHGFVMRVVAYAVVFYGVYKVFQMVLPQYYGA